jgi:small conductance mechanosensitive channel
MEFLQDLIMSFDWHAIVKIGLRVLVILAVAWIAIKVLKKILHRLELKLTADSSQAGEPPSESQKRIGTIVRLTRQTTMLLLWLTVSLMVLMEFGIEIGPIIASAGIVGLAVGFGAQNLVRDFISGFFIILENQIRVGDVAIINGTGGLVENINFRTTVIRDLSGVVHIFANGSITTLSNLTNEWSAYVFDIGVAYKENTDRVIEVMRAVGKSMREDEKYGDLMLEDVDVFGVDKFADSAIVIKGRLRTKPIRQWEVGREFLRRVKLAFDEHGIEIPFPHLSLYFGEASKPIDLELLTNRPDQIAATD